MGGHRTATAAAAVDSRTERHVRRAQRCYGRGGAGGAGEILDLGLVSDCFSHPSLPSTPCRFKRAVSVLFRWTSFTRLPPASAGSGRLGVDESAPAAVGMDVIVSRAVGMGAWLPPFS